MKKVGLPGKDKSFKGKLKQPVKEFELREVECIRPIEEIENDSEQEEIAGFDSNELSEVTVKEAQGVKYLKESDHIIAQKLALIKEQQASIEKATKWMWQVRKNGKFRAFGRPKRSLEQYITPIQDALSIGYIIESEISDKIVADLGAGTGMLGIVCSLAGAK